MIKILALDPALNHTGWVILRYTETGKGRDGIRGSVYGSIKVNPKMPFPEKLLQIKQEVSSIIMSHKPDFIVIEDTFTGNNAKTVAKLNCVKGVVTCTSFECTKKEPSFVLAKQARSCLGFSDNKEDVFAYFKQLFKLPEDFKKGNDITDAYAVGFWYILDQRNACVEKEKKARNGRRKKRNTQRDETKKG